MDLRHLPANFLRIAHLAQRHVLRFFPRKMVKPLQILNFVLQMLPQFLFHRFPVWFKPNPRDRGIQPRLYSVFFLHTAPSFVFSTQGFSLAE